MVPEEEQSRLAIRIWIDSNELKRPVEILVPPEHQGKMKGREFLMGQTIQVSDFKVCLAGT